MTRPDVTICFRGAGLLFPFYAGIVAVLRRLGILTRVDHWYGMSSGSLMAVFAASGVPVEPLLLTFARRIYPYQHLPWRQDLAFRYRWIPVLLRNAITDDQARQCSGKLTILAYSFTRLAVVHNSRWRDRQHVIDWVLASMAMPFTSGPRWVENQWLMDPYHFDRVPLPRCWFDWPRGIIMASPVELSSWVDWKPPQTRLRLASVLLDRDPLSSYRAGVKCLFDWPLFLFWLFVTMSS